MDKRLCGTRERFSDYGIDGHLDGMLGSRHARGQPSTDDSELVATDEQVLSTRVIGSMEAEAKMSREAWDNHDCRVTLARAALKAAEETSDTQMTKVQRQQGTPYTVVHIAEDAPERLSISS
ncbi:hypothetical protein Tco_0155067 [Tanacetum coccineum]